MTNWLDACVQVRKKVEGVLAVIVTGSCDMGLDVEALLSRLQYAAHRLRMDFLPLLPLSAGAGSQYLSSALLNRSREESRGTHWGLNE